MTERLDRIEKLVESNALAIQSNAKSILSLSNDIAEMKRDRDTMYDLMRDLTNKMSVLVAAQAESYETTKNLDRRQDQLANQQQQLIQIIESLNKDINKQND